MSHSEGIMMSQEIETENPTNAGVADYFESIGADSGIMLIAKAPDVIILAKIIGAPRAAHYFSKAFGLKVTEKQIKGIKAKVASGRFTVTKEELILAANSHPISAARLLREPSIAEPGTYRLVTTPEGPVKVAVKKTPTKKVNGVAVKPIANAVLPEGTEADLESNQNPEAPPDVPSDVPSDTPAPEVRRCLSEAFQTHFEEFRQILADLDELGEDNGEDNGEDKRLLVAPSIHVKRTEIQDSPSLRAIPARIN